MVYLLLWKVERENEIERVEERIETSSKKFFDILALSYYVGKGKLLNIEIEGEKKGND